MKSGNREDWHKEYEQLAYEIYCNDETFANMRGKELPEDFLYLFYLKGNGEKRVEFLHRSFYQYFLAHFLYQKMSEVEDEASAEAFLCCLAERRIDRDILNYIQQIQEKKPDVTQEKCEQIINTLEQTGTIIVQALEMPNKNGDAEKHPLSRCENILTNVLNICSVVAAGEGSEFIVSLYEKRNIHASMQRYFCNDICLRNVDLRRANLFRADLARVDLTGIHLDGATLCRAYLLEADLIGVHLDRADLSSARLCGAYLSGAHLCGAYLRKADLTGAHLSEADLAGANLREASLNSTYLRGADLAGADLRGADLRWAEKLDQCHCKQVDNWTGCKILLRDKYNLGLDDTDAHGIIWCDNETGNPIDSHEYDIARYDDENDDPIERYLTWYDDDGTPIEP